MIDEMLEELHATNEEAVYPTDLKDCIIGTVERSGMGPIVLLDKDKVIETYMKRDGMVYEDAHEFYEFNVLGSWVGNGTPAFATLLKE